jgi:phosphoribosyl 1,2-cyclic phosphodiesterase
VYTSRTRSVRIRPFAWVNVALRLAVLGSGSGGNATLIEGDGARILVDAGFSCRGLVQRLRYVGVEPDTLDAILITHEHADHLGGAAAFSGKHGVPIYCTRGTARAAGLSIAPEGELPFPSPARPVEAGRDFAVGRLTVRPFGVPHDAVETVGFVVSDGDGARVGYATDLGHGPRPVRDGLLDCDALVVEANHDLGMLRAGPYPESVKERVLSRHGHLDNTAAADLLCDVARERTRTVVLAHLSRTNNHPEIALHCVRRRFADHGRRAPTVLAADQAKPMPWMTVA